MDNNKFSTPITNLAIYLIQEGFELLRIEYQPLDNGKNKAYFVFNHSPQLIKQSEETYFQKKATINIAEYENTRKNLLDRIKRGLP